MARHNIASRLATVEEEIVNFTPTPEQAATLQGIDTQFVEIQRNGEKNAGRF